MKKQKEVEVIAKPRASRKATLTDKIASAFLVGAAFALGMYAVIALVDALGI